jgi:hypothetical protein
MRRFSRYKQNLAIVTTEKGDFIRSYSTNVAKIDYGTKAARQLGWWSATTQKHINYACRELGLKLDRNGF